MKMILLQYFYARILPVSDGKALHKGQVLRDFHVVADSFSYYLL